ncbi:MAG TPA: tail fiber domain-containing protein, partial [Bacteroidia bacterium]|nr:tail fiber domain-containing protein [Bacteroidia bacterium]
SVNDKIKKLSGYTYYMNTEEFKDKNFSKEQQIGLIAQELKEVFPQLVKEDAKGYLAVNYQGMVPVLLEAIKEQQNTIEKLTAQNDEVVKQVSDVKKQLDELKAMMQAQNANSDNRLSINLSDLDAVVLNQNVPNPFAEQTVITYNIPQNANTAQLLFYDVNGKQIQNVTITTKGRGQLNVYANDLTSGVYSYTLIVDGKIIDTKKMAKQD